MVHRKVLLISRGAWRNDRNSGGTYTSLFKNWPSNSVSHLYTRPENPSNSICKEYFRITDMGMLKSLYSSPAGKAFSYINISEETQKMKKIFPIRDTARFMTGSFAPILREFLWKLGKINYSMLDQWVEERNPEYIHLSGTDSLYLYRIASHIKKKYHLPYVMYISDDIYFGNNSLSPLYLIHRNYLRKVVRSFITGAQSVFVISEKQKNEYEKVFHRSMEVVTKDLPKNAVFMPKPARNIKELVYTGNLSGGRWKTLATLASSIQRINQKNIVCHLSIYSNIKVTAKIQRRLNLENASSIFPSVSYSKIPNILSNADILVHVESFEKTEARLSFSAKLVEYFAAGRCILAIGPPSFASIDYLIQKDAAYVICNRGIETVTEKIKALVDYPYLIEEYAQKAFSCGIKHHSYASFENIYLSSINTPRNMRVIQINTVCGTGSTGRNTVEIAEMLKAKGVTTYIAYGHGTTDYDKTFIIGNKLENKLHIAFGRLTGKQGYFTKKGTLSLLNFIDHYQPDVIHLNNLHGNYLCFPILLSYIAKNKIPTIYTLHDCWAYTGKCAHYVGTKCKKWKTGCGNCPEVKDYPSSLFFDYSAKMFSDKKRLFDSISNLTLVAVSDWITAEIRQSMLSKHKIVRIYNWIDTSVFFPRLDRKVEEKYGIKENEFVVLGVCGKWSKGKGIREWRKICEKVGYEIRVVLVGNKEPGEPFPKECIHIPYTSDPSELAVIYSRADVFCNLSSAESFGKTTAEALMCGTPIIVFDTTACPELVGPGCGFVCRLSDCDDVVEKIGVIQQTGKDAYSNACISFALDNFSPNTNIEAYYKEYIKATIENYEI